MSLHNSFVATYANKDLVKGDIERLESAGFDLSHMTVIARNLTGIKSELGGMKLIMSLKGLDASLYSCIPESDILDYETELKTGRYILVAYGTPEEIARVKYLADSAHPLSWGGVVDATVYYGCVD